jgi:hypothetical protein
MDEGRYQKIHYDLDLNQADIEQRRSSCYYFSLAPKEVSLDLDLLWWSAEDST